MKLVLGLALWTRRRAIYRTADSITAIYQAGMTNMYNLEMMLVTKRKSKKEVMHSKKVSEKRE